MIVLLDTDILIDVALGRTPFVESSTNVLDAAENRLFRSYIAWHSISNFHYMVDSTTDDFDSKDFIVELLQFVDVAPTTTRDARYAITLNLSDFEDALQVAAARACGAELILSRNVKHYKKSPVPAQTPKDFLAHPAR